jgi:molybdopterin-guanine dinucleotide biosynthesis protein A
LKHIGLITVGGKSTRFGADKCQATFRGNSFLSHARERLQELAVDECLLLGRPGLSGGIADPAPGKGPAVNITYWINEQWDKNQQTPFRLTILPIDMPGLNHDLLALLLAPAPGAYFDDLYLPLSAVIDAPLSEPVFRMKDLLRNLGLKALPFSEAQRQALTNVNTKADLAAILGN